MLQLSGKTAVVTGGAGGIGLGIAHALAREGARVAIGDIEAPRLEEAATELRALGADVFAQELDVADAASLGRFAQAVAEKFGSPTILCANAGVLVRKPLVESTPEDWQWVFGVNVFGIVNTLRAFLPAMTRATGDRHVLVTASMSSLRASPVAGTTLYSGSKWAVFGLAEALRREIEPHGIGLSLLCPGGVATALWTAERNRPGATTVPAAPTAADRRKDGLGDDQLDPREVGRIALEGIRARRRYIITHPHQWNDVEALHAGIAAAFRDAAHGGS